MFPYMAKYTFTDWPLRVRLIITDFSIGKERKRGRGSGPSGNWPTLKISYSSHLLTLHVYIWVYFIWYYPEKGLPSFCWVNLYEFIRPKIVSHTMNIHTQCYNCNVTTLILSHTHINSHTQNFYIHIETHWWIRKVSISIFFFFATSRKKNYFTCIQKTLHLNWICCIKEEEEEKMFNWTYKPVWDKNEWM